MVRVKALNEHDFVHWKLDKFVKDDDQRTEIKKLVYENFYFLKSCFVEMAS